MHVLEQRVREGEPDFLLAVRDLAGEMGGDPDAKKLWRLVYRVENLAAMKRNTRRCRAWCTSCWRARGPYRTCSRNGTRTWWIPAELAPARELAPGACRGTCARTAYD